MAHSNYYIRPLDVGGSVLPVPAEPFYAESLRDAMALAKLRWPTSAALVWVRKSSKMRRPVR